MRLVPAFSRYCMHSYFCFGGEIYRLDTAPTGVLRGFLAVPMARALMECTQGENAALLREQYHTLEREPEWDYIDRWWMLNLLTEQGLRLPLAETWTQATRLRPSPEMRASEPAGSRR